MPHRLPQDGAGSAEAVFQSTAEQVHGFRTTTRRLQTLLEELIPERGRNQKKLLKLLGQIRKRAGKVRDLDVQLAALRSLKIPQEPRRKTQLMHGLIELRAKHEKKLRKLLTKEAIREIRKRLKRAFKDSSSKPAALPWPSPGRCWRRFVGLRNCR